MKKGNLSAFILFAALVLSSCHSEIEQDLSTLERKVNNLYETVSSLNVQVTQIQSLFTKLQQYDYVKSVREDFSHDVQTFVISFTNSDPITLSCGSDAETPIIGIAYDIDGRAYWTVKYGNGTTDFLLNEYDQKVLVSAITPQVRINEEGQWEVSYNEGKVWKSLGITAAGAQGASFVESVEEIDGFVQIKLLSGQVITLPLQETFEKLMDDISALNENIQSLIAFSTKIKNSLISVKSVTKIEKDGEEVGFKLTLSDNSSYSFYHGAATNKPFVTAMNDIDNPADSAALYWAIKYGDAEDYEWLLTDDGDKMRADYVSGISPLFQISPTGTGSYIWMISTDGGASYSPLMRDGKYVSAQTVANDAGITSLTRGNGYYILKIFDQTYQIPDGTDMNVTFNGVPADSLSLQMTPSDTLDVRYAVSGNGLDFLQATLEVAAYARDGFKVWVEKDWLGFFADAFNGVIHIVSPETFVSGSTVVTVMFSDNKGGFMQYDIKIVSATEEEEEEQEEQEEEEEEEETQTEEGE